ncbi:DNA-binding protein WhiA [Sesbania bispinosa]|nr:DNA-binding protein WhiA [Sesbania bispinosa]
MNQLLSSREEDDLKESNTKKVKTFESGPNSSVVNASSDVSVRLSLVDPKEGISSIPDTKLETVGQVSKPTPQLSYKDTRTGASRGQIL